MRRINILAGIFGLVSTISFVAYILSNFLMFGWFLGGDSGGIGMDSNFEVMYILNILFLILSFVSTVGCFVLGIIQMVRNKQSNASNLTLAAGILNIVFIPVAVVLSFVAASRDKASNVPTPIEDPLLP